MAIDSAPLLVSLRLASISTLLLVIIGVPTAYHLSDNRSIPALVLRSCIMLPLILPPSVLGFYFLLLGNPSGVPGAFIARFAHIRLTFSFEGLVIASCAAGLPFMVNPILAGFQGLPPSLREAAASLGKSPVTIVIKVLLPSIRPSLLTGILMTFIHVFGEFGLVLFVGGQIPGKTVTMSIALYNCVESLDFVHAHLYAALIAACSFSTLIALFLVDGKTRGNRP
jgi:molybdate transport system permease protein